MPGVSDYFNIGTIVASALIGFLGIVFSFFLGYSQGWFISFLIFFV